MYHFRKLVVPFAIVAGLFGAPSASPAQINNEYPIKAGIVGVIGDFFTWPADAPKAPPGKRLIIGVLGNDPFDQGDVHHLRAVAANKNHEFIHFPRIDQLQPCHILFVPRRTAMKEVAAAIKRQAVLVIGEEPGLAKQGAVINLVVDLRANGGRGAVNLEFNPDAARRSNLRYNSRLLDLADVVRD